jgi:hypothetical protein
MGAQNDVTPKLLLQMQSRRVCERSARAVAEGRRRRLGGVFPVQRQSLEPSANARSVVRNTRPNRTHCHAQLVCLRDRRSVRTCLTACSHVESSSWRGATLGLFCCHSYLLCCVFVLLCCVVKILPSLVLSFFFLLSLGQTSTFRALCQPKTFFLACRHITTTSLPTRE